MTRFTEANTVEQMILDTATHMGPRLFRDAPAPYAGESLGDALRPARWEYVPASALPRQTTDVMVEPRLREALIRLNPEIAAQPDRADEVIYKFAILPPSAPRPGARQRAPDGLAPRERSMPFGPGGEHVPVRLVDAARGRQPPDGHQPMGVPGGGGGEAVRRRVPGERLPSSSARPRPPAAPSPGSTAPTRSAIYEVDAPPCSCPTCLLATEGRLYRYGAIRMPIESWGPWRDEPTRRRASPPRAGRGRACCAPRWC